MIEKITQFLDKRGMRKFYFFAILLGSLLCIIVITLMCVWASEQEGGFLTVIKEDYYHLFLFLFCIFFLIFFIFFIFIHKYEEKNSINYFSHIDVPIIFISEDYRIFWSNIDNISVFKDYTPIKLLNYLLLNPHCQPIIKNAFDSNVKDSFQQKILFGNDVEKYFNVQVSSVVKASKRKLCSLIFLDITQNKIVEEKYENTQREFQTQTEMLAIINAQLAVQEAGIKEQNEKLVSNQKQLEDQTLKLLKANSDLEEQNYQITVKTGYITDSIKYAKTIQEASLPSSEQMNRFFENFVLYRPKDIVSGDFYWISMQETYTFVVLGDCTGHGVPGAFMSMIGIRILVELINENKLNCPSVILEAMHDRIVSALKQNITENEDGMDIAICKIEISDKPEEGKFKLTYAGAKQSIFIKETKNQEVVQIKPDRRGIGGNAFSDIFFFTDQEFYLSSGDRIYITSDGYRDQNNSKHKRFGIKRFIQLLQELTPYELNKQKKIIEDTIDTWQGYEEQRDDISLIGFQLGESLPEPLVAIL